MHHSIKQLVLLYQVYSILCLYNELIFLIWLLSKWDKSLFLKQLVLLYQVLFFILIYLLDLPKCKTIEIVHSFVKTSEIHLTNIPFENGRLIIKKNSSFKEITAESIISDESTSMK